MNKWNYQYLLSWRWIICKQEFINIMFFFEDKEWLNMGNQKDEIFIVLHSINSILKYFIYFIYTILTTIILILIVIQNIYYLISCAYTHLA